jgi:MFS family permease
MMALVLFVAGSVLCSTAWSIETLIAFRIIQGLGGGMLMPLGMTIMTHAAGPHRVGRVMAVLGVPMLLGPICGPILGGWLIEAVSWHWIFLINVPIGIVALIAAFFLLPSDRPAPSESFDFLGMLMLSPGLALFLFGVSSIPEMGTVASARVLIPAAIGLVLVALFVPHALRGAMLSMPLAGRLADKTGPGKIVLVGIVFIVAGMSVFTQVGADTPYALLLGALFVMGLGMGATMMPIMTAALATLTHHEVARGSTLMNIVNQTAGSIGTATMSVVLTNLLLQHELAGAAIASQADPSIAAQLPPAALNLGFAQAADAFGNTFLVATVIMVLTFIPAAFLPRKRAEIPTEQASSATIH